MTISRFTDGLSRRIPRCLGQAFSVHCLNKPKKLLLVKGLTLQLLEVFIKVEIKYFWQAKRNHIVIIRYLLDSLGPTE